MAAPSDPLQGQGPRIGETKGTEQFSGPVQSPNQKRISGIASKIRGAMTLPAIFRKRTSVNLETDLSVPMAPRHLSAPTPYPSGGIDPKNIPNMVASVKAEGAGPTGTDGGTPVKPQKPGQERMHATVRLAKQKDARPDSPTAISTFPKGNVDDQVSIHSTPKTTATLTEDKPPSVAFTGLNLRSVEDQEYMHSLVEDMRGNGKDQDYIHAYTPVDQALVNYMSCRKELDEYKSNNPTKFSQKLDSAMEKAETQLKHAISEYRKEQHATVDEKLNIVTNLKKQLQKIDMSISKLSQQQTQKKEELEQQKKILEQQIGQADTELSAAMTTYQDNLMQSSAERSHRLKGIEIIAAAFSQPKVFPLGVTVSQLYDDPIGRNFLQESSISGGNLPNFVAFSLSDFCLKEMTTVSEEDREPVSNICSVAINDLVSRRQTYVDKFKMTSDDREVKELNTQIEAIAEMHENFVKLSQSDPTGAKNEVKKLLLYCCIDSDGPYAINLTGERGAAEAALGHKETWSTEHSSSQNLRVLHNHLQMEINTQVLAPEKGAGDFGGGVRFRVLPLKTQEHLIELASAPPKRAQT